MNKESTSPAKGRSVGGEPARPPAAASRAPAAGPMPQAEDRSGPGASRLHYLDEVVRQVKGELERGQERQRGSNPYDSLLGQPTRDVWGTRRRA